MKNDLLQGLMTYFENATPEQLEADGEEMKEYQDIGPTVEEYLEYIEYIEKTFKL